MTERMCEFESEGLFNMISRNFGESYKRTLKGWVKNKFKINLALQQKKFLIKCRQFDVLPPHIYNIKFVASLRSIQHNRKYANLKKNYQRRLLNLEIKDIHSQINYLRAKIEGMERYVKSKLPESLLKKFLRIE